MLTGSNRRPPPCKGDALPAELSIRLAQCAKIIYHFYKYAVNEKNAFLQDAFSLSKLILVLVAFFA